MFEESVKNLRKVTFDFVKTCFPPLDRQINKSNLGRLIIVGGSTNYVGAVLFAAEAAMRVGLGTSMIAVPSSISSDIRQRVLYSGIYPLADNGGSIVFDEKEIENLLNGATACVLGVGGGNGEFGKIANFLCDNSDLNFVLDADGFKTVSDKKKFGYRAVFTPHPKEFSRLTGICVNDILNNPVKLAEKYAAEHEVVLLLKGYKTIITDGSQTVLNDVGSPKMAKGGSGDVLSGVIGSLLARGIAPFTAAAAGAYICGKAACISDVNEYSFLPTDTIDCIVKVIDELTLTN